ncbi:hypothetical protein CERSUDRAFT_85159 [Gelatoporia subvermispora B]|uniref:SET domain-containing protein n=1 Tax=Ceriporiopsis subvermispora (strain B) TaxID=914234 RepID=M2RB94_CERS8|nr:hypothetical protein CERSUDRAFT_85159 [Gelatoporia subvermispora B]
MVITKIPANKRSLPADAYTHVVCLPEVKKAMLAASGWPAPFSPPSPPVYEIKSAGRKYSNGLGAFAVADIKPGDLIMQERALLITSRHVALPKGDKGRLREIFLEQCWAEMGHFHRKTMQALHNCYGSDAEPLRGIVDTNALPADTLPGPTDIGGIYSAVFNHLARINHSCSPNVRYRWDIETFSGQVHAFQPIKAGEQLFISYCDLEYPRGLRQEELRKLYRFDCACPSCVLPRYQGRLSDWRRLLIIEQAFQDLSKTDADLRAWATNPRLPDPMLVDAAEIWYGWMMQERVLNSVLLPTVLERLCKAYCALEDEGNARKYARAAAAYEKALEGSDSGWGIVAASPEKTSWWGLRVRARRQQAPSI